MGLMDDMNKAMYSAVPRKIELTKSAQRFAAQD